MRPFGVFAFFSCHASQERLETPAVEWFAYRFTCLRDGMPHKRRCYAATSPVLLIMAPSKTLLFQIFFVINTSATLAVVQITWVTGKRHILNTFRTSHVP